MDRLYEEIEVEEEEVKSALEIAMERISGMPELTQEEIAEQREKEYAPVGEGLCNKYIQDLISAKNLRLELNKHTDDSGRIILKSLVSNLCRSIQLEDPQTAGKALHGLFELAENSGGFREEAQGQWNRLLLDFMSRMEEKAKEFEAAAIESFKKLGISGSAVRPNLIENEQWRQESDRLRKSFDPELEKLRTLWINNFQSE